MVAGNAFLFADFFDFVDSPYWKVGIVVAGFLVGGLAGGLLARGLWLLTFRHIAAAALLRSRIVGGIVGAVLAYAFFGTPGFGPGPGGVPGGGHVSLVSDQDVAQDDVDNTVDLPSDQPTATSETLTILLVGKDRWEKAGKPARKFFAMEGPGEPPLDADAAVSRVDEALKSGKLKKGDRVELTPESEQSSSPTYNPEVKVLEQKVKEKGLRFSIASAPRTGK